MSELRHPGIVAHVAHGQVVDGQRFLAMEWLDGQDLGQRLARGPLLLRESIQLLSRVCDALRVAHERGIIHRDLKPSNLFLVGGDIERVKILDFGLARRIATSQVMTRTGMVIGTPQYMAPEQARGLRELTPAVDLVLPEGIGDIVGAELDLMQGCAELIAPARQVLGGVERFADGQAQLHFGMADADEVANHFLRALRRFDGRASRLIPSR